MCHKNVICAHSLSSHLVCALHKFGLNIHRIPMASEYPRPLCALTTALLLLSGDVELNPGPRAKNASVFPCGICEQPVTWSCKGAACDNCDVWYHQSCIELCSADFELLNNSNVSWICYKCDGVNCGSFTFRSYELECSNVYAPLSAVNDSLASIDSSSIFNRTKVSSQSTDHLNHTISLQQRHHHQAHLAAHNASRKSLICEFSL